MKRASRSCLTSSAPGRAGRWRWRRRPASRRTRRRGRAGLRVEVQQRLELGLGLARETDDEGGAHGDVRAQLAPAQHPLQASCPPRRGVSSA
jgi:hypothetical protein